MKITPTPEEGTNPKYPTDSKGTKRMPKAQTTSGMMPELPRPKRPQRLGGIAIDLEKLGNDFPKKKKKS